MTFETIMRDCASEEDRRQRCTAAVAAEEKRLADETLAQVQAGNYDRLREAFDFRDHDETVFRALVLCANKGNVEAKEALDKLAKWYGEWHAEVEE